MAKITIEELSDSLKEYLNGLGLTEIQIHELIYLWIDNKIDINIDLQTEAKTIVPAINEVKDAIDNKDLSAYQTVEDNDLLTTNKTIVEAINEIYNSQDIVKQELVAILVNKGLSVTTDMSFNELIDSTENIVAVQGNAIASDVLSGKTFINNTGELITGNMVNQGSKTITPKASSQTLAAGYYSGITVSGDSNLIASNIKSGVNIFGVTGNIPSYVTASGSISGNYEYGYLNHSLGKSPSSVTATVSSINISATNGNTVKSYSYSGSVTLTWGGGSVYIDCTSSNGGTCVAVLSIDNISSSSVTFNVTSNADTLGYVDSFSAYVSMKVYR